MTNEEYTKDNGRIYRGKSPAEEERQTDNQGEMSLLWKEQIRYYLDRIEPKKPHNNC